MQRLGAKSTVACCLWFGACGGGDERSRTMEVVAPAGTVIAFGDAIADGSAVYATRAVPYGTIAVSVVDDKNRNGRVDLADDRTMPCDRREGAWVCGAQSPRLMLRTENGSPVAILAANMRADYEFVSCRGGDCTALPISSEHMSLRLCDHPADSITLRRVKSGDGLNGLSMTVLLEALAAHATASDAELGWQYTSDARTGTITLTGGGMDEDRPAAVALYRIPDRQGVAASATLRDRQLRIQISPPYCLTSQSCDFAVGVAFRYPAPRWGEVELSRLSENYLQVSL